MSRAIVDLLIGLAALAVIVVGSGVLLWLLGGIWTGDFSGRGKSDA